MSICLGRRILVAQFGISGHAAVAIEMDLVPDVVGFHRGDEPRRLAASLRVWNGMMVVGSAATADPHSTGGRPCSRRTCDCAP